MKRLIVNADDFGIATSVNDGIMQGHKEGIVTSTTILAGGAAFGHAVRLAGENPALGVGVHLCLTIERPVSDPSEIPSLTKSGALPAGPLNAFPRILFGLTSMKDVETELRAQVEKCISAGIKPTHLDGHQHLHVMPRIFPLVLSIARDYDIPAVRFPVGPWHGKAGVPRTMEKLILEGMALRHKGVLERSGIKRPDWFFGLPETGRMDADALMSIIAALPDGTSEVMCHPGRRDDARAKETGWGYGWETELNAVMDAGVRRMIQDGGIELINFESFRA